MNSSAAQSPQVSVIIPVYNRESLIERAVNSVLAQTDCDFEVIVVDDGSSDGTLAVLESYQDKIRAISQPNAGRSAARNTGLHAAKGEFIAFLDSDDEFLPGKLAKQLKFHHEHSNCVFSGHGIVVDDTQTRTEQSPRTDQSLLTADPYMAVLNYFCFFPSVVMAKRSLLVDLGGFDTSYHGAEDLDLALKAALKGEVGVFSDCLTVMHQHAGQTARKQLAEMNVKVMERHLELFSDEFSEARKRDLGKKLARYTISIAKRAKGAERAEALARALKYDPKLKWKPGFWKLKLLG